MKRLRSVVLLVTVLLMTTMSFSLLRVEGTYSAFAKQSGLGLGVSFPLIPLVDTTLYVHMLGDADISGTADFDGFTFSGTTEVSSTALEMQAKLPLSLMDVNFGATFLMDFMNGKEPTSQKDFIFISGMYAGVFGYYQKPVSPLISLFGQMGLLVKVVDGAKIINDQATGAGINLGNLDRSGFYFRAGIAIGL
ncbi:MAG: hypothetical protein PHF25_02530 [Candidatus Margulisbacteria bacterium]|nr:hypothetical protein [Candidatus Margulisiibacteriota bacterium]